MVFETYIFAGPVASGDMIGALNSTRLMQTSTANGTLLKPDRPAVPVDSAYLFEFGKKERAYARTHSSHTHIHTHRIRTYTLIMFPLSNTGTCLCRGSAGAGGGVGHLFRASHQGEHPTRMCDVILSHISGLNIPMDVRAGGGAAGAVRTLLRCRWLAAAAGRVSLAQPHRRRSDQSLAVPHFRRR